MGLKNSIHKNIISYILPENTSVFADNVRDHI